jgi:hypothetical protein
MNNLVNWFNYVNAWIAYAGALLTKISGFGALIRDSITSLHIPQKDDYFSEQQ